MGHVVTTALPPGPIGSSVNRRTYGATWPRPATSILGTFVGDVAPTNVSYIHCYTLRWSVIYSLIGSSVNRRIYDKFVKL
jgi:hypothetical protein